MVALELQLGAAAGVPDGEFLRFQLCPFDSWDGSGMGVCASSGALPECGDGSAHWVEVEGGTGCGLGAYRVPRR